MGHFAWLAVGVSVVTVSGVGAAQSAATGTFPPARGPAAASSSVAAPLPPPPPAPPAAAPSAAPSNGPGAGPAPTPAAPSVGAPPAAPPGAYVQPYPPYPGYPPPGYGYYYPPPAALAHPRFPSNAAVSSSPFVDALASSVSWQYRVSQALNVGLQAGMYAAGRIRLTVKATLPTTALNDDYYGFYDSNPNGTAYYYREPSKTASLFYGASVGVVAVSSANFVMAPGVAFSRTDVSDYGSSLGVSLPFEWVTANGLRMGVVLDFGRAFGGSAHVRCMPNGGASNATCATTPTLSQDRPAGTSVALQFQLGFGFNHPAELPAEPIQNAPPYAWPQPQQPQPAAPPTPPPAAPSTPSPAPAGAPAQSPG